MTAFIPDPSRAPGAEQRRLRPLRPRHVLRPWRRLVAILVMSFCVSLALPAAGELIVFTHGGYLKVAAFEVDGDHVRLDLLRGGSMNVPLMTVARILEDEVASVREEPLPTPPPQFEVVFQEHHRPPATPYGGEIYEVAKRHALNPALVAAVARAESNFDPRAVSHKGACGLMQLMPATAQRFGVEGDEVFNPASNLDAGSRYLRWLVKRFDGRLTHILAAYNSGEGTVDRYGGVPPYGETRRYLRRIFADLGLPESELDAAFQGT